MRRPEWFAAISKAKAAATARLVKRHLVFADQMAAATHIASDATSREFGAPTKFNNGTTARHAEAPPARSAPYKLEIRSLDRAKSTENNNPVRKKGTAATM